MSKLLLFTFVLIGCMNVEPNNIVLKDDVISKKTDEKEVIEKNKSFKYNDDSIELQIIVAHKTSLEFYFEYLVYNKVTGCRDYIKGIAKNLYPDSDPELDEDEDGFGYPSIEYIYSNNDQKLAIRLAMNSEDKIVTKASGFVKKGCVYQKDEIVLRLVQE